MPPASASLWPSPTMPFFLCSLGLPACHGGRLGCLPGCPAWRASLCRDEGPGAERRAQVCRGRAPGRRTCPLASSARLFTKVPLPSPLRLTHCWDPSTQLEPLQTKQRLPSSPQLRVPTHGLAGPSSPPGWEYGPGLQRVEESVPRKSRPWGGWGPSPWRCCSSDGTGVGDIPRRRQVSACSTSLPHAGLSQIGVPSCPPTPAAC